MSLLKVDKRADWISAIEQGSFDRQCKEISWGPLYARSILDDKDFLNMSISDLPKLEEGTTGNKKNRLVGLKNLDMLS